MRKLTKEEFILKANDIHNMKYYYYKVNYSSNKNKVAIICPTHGEFEQTPNSHLIGQGCPKCGKINKAKNKKLKTEDFIKKSQLLHGNRYDYSLTKYVDYDTSIKIICYKHGEFEQTPHSHLIGSGCKQCGNVSSPTTKEFINKAKLVHGDRYDYRLVKYKNAKTKLKIICNIHGEFEQSSNNHLVGQGCPVCRESKGEKEIRIFLKLNNIKYIPQYKFIDCKNIRRLPFDFYLPELNVCIEYDGIQHFKEIKKWGGINTLKYIQRKDQIKTNYCGDKEIGLIRIKYDENVFIKITDSLNKLKYGC